MISERLTHIQNQIAEAAKISGRDASQDVTLICVTKNATIEQVFEAVEWGIRDIGENRVQVALQKFDLLKDKGLCWHMIGHLQTNKVKHAIKLFDTIHSIDTIDLVNKLETELEKNGAVDKKFPVLLEVNTSGEGAKFGTRSLDEMLRLVEAISSSSYIALEGLMTMAPFLDDPQQTRPYFERLRQLKDDINKRAINGVCMRHLSMGMSQDFKVAVEEGATLVRIGSAIFNEDYPLEGL